VSLLLIKTGKSGKKETDILIKNNNYLSDSVFIRQASFAAYNEMFMGL